MFSRQYSSKEQQQCSSSKFKYLKDRSGNIPTRLDSTSFFLFGQETILLMHQNFRSMLWMHKEVGTNLSFRLCRRKHSANVWLRTAAFQSNHQELLLPPLRAHPSPPLMATNQSNRSFLTSMRSSLCRGHWRARQVWRNLTWTPSLGILMSVSET